MSTFVMKSQQPVSIKRASLASFKIQKDAAECAENPATKQSTQVCLKQPMLIHVLIMPPREFHGIRERTSFEFMPLVELNFNFRFAGWNKTSGGTNNLAING